MRLAGLDEAARASDAEAFHRHAHALKGTAAMLGAGRVQAVCQRLETMVGEGNMPAAKGMIAEVKREIGAVEPALRAFVKA